MWESEMEMYSQISERQNPRKCETQKWKDQLSENDSFTHEKINPQKWLKKYTSKKWTDQFCERSTLWKINSQKMKVSVMERSTPRKIKSQKNSALRNDKFKSQKWKTQMRFLKRSNSLGKIKSQTYSNTTNTSRKLDTTPFMFSDAWFLGPMIFARKTHCCWLSDLPYRLDFWWKPRSMLPGDAWIFFPGASSFCTIDLLSRSEISELKFGEQKNSFPAFSMSWAWVDNQAETDTFETSESSLLSTICIQYAGAACMHVVVSMPISFWVWELVSFLIDFEFSERFQFFHFWEISVFHFWEISTFHF